MFLVYIANYDWYSFTIYRMPSIVSNIHDDFIFEPFESQIKHSRSLSTEVPSLLSANQLLELACDPFLDQFPHTFLFSLNYVLSSYINYTKFGTTLFECRFWTNLIQLAGFLYQMHLICHTRIWLISVRYFCWKSKRCPD